jgi:transcription antitermination factor NusG
MKASIDPSKCWFVVRTAPGAELKASESLRKAGFDRYLPLVRIEKWNKRANTYHTFERPLMPRYLFVGLPKENLAFGFVRACDGVERILGDQDNHPIAVFPPVVDAILSAEIDMQFDDTRAARKHRGETLDRMFPAGARVIVAKLNRIFDGAVAEVIRTNGADRIQISLGALGTPWVKPEQIAVA